MGEVTLHDISKRFTLRIDGALQTVQALSRVNFTVQDGEIVSLIGPSGCGKTTALRIAMGLETASAGKVTVDGREVRGCGHDRGMVFQFAELLAVAVGAAERDVRPGDEGHARGASCGTPRRATSSSSASRIRSTAARISCPAA